MKNPQPGDRVKVTRPMQQVMKVVGCAPETLPGSRAPIGTYVVRGVSDDGERVLLRPVAQFSRAIFFRLVGPISHVERAA